MKATDVQIGGDHYKRMPIQPIEFALANRLGFGEGMVLKYVARWREKGGVEDLKKARHVLDLMIEHEQKRMPTRKEIFDATSTGGGAPAEHAQWTEEERAIIDKARKMREEHEQREADSKVFEAASADIAKAYRNNPTMAEQLKRGVYFQIGQNDIAAMQNPAED